METTVEDRKWTYTPGRGPRRGAARSGSPRRLWKASALLVVSSFLLAACTTSDPLAEQASAANTNYVAGDGSVAEYPPGERSPISSFEATLEDGTVITTADLEGQVTVLNFWYAACAPCRVEAPDLQALNEEFSAAGAAAEKSAAKEDLDALDQEFGGREVQFLGINLRDQQATSSAFERSFGITYPSALDTDGSIAMGLSEFVPPQAVPTTVVIDKDGRISARVLGIAEKSTLRALINTAVETSG